MKKRIDMNNDEFDELEKGLKKGIKEMFNHKQGLKVFIYSDGEISGALNIHDGPHPNHEEPIAEIKSIRPSEMEYFEDEHPETGETKEGFLWDNNEQEWVDEEEILEVIEMEKEDYITFFDED